MKVKDFDYQLPPELIAQVPELRRDASRLLHYDRSSRKLEHRKFSDLKGLLKKGDTLVINNTKVIPARLFAVDDRHRKLEVFLLKRLSEDFLNWQCLVKPGKRLPVDSKKATLKVAFLEGASGELSRDSEEQGVFRLALKLPTSPIKQTFEEWVERAGLPPLPPYLKREASKGDKETYQTVYADPLGSVAAPTAGLHFTRTLLEEIAAKGVEIAPLTLHVGYGTFSPIRVSNLDEHKMHSEFFEISEEVFGRIQTRRKQGGRTIAVGTTSLRALESVKKVGLKGETQLFIKPGYEFSEIDGLVTNFHLPQSSLYILVCALMGLENAQRCYQTAIEAKYRFFSYGDAMAIL